MDIKPAGKLLCSKSSS